MHAFTLDSLSALQIGLQLGTSLQKLKSMKIERKQQIHSQLLPLLALLAALAAMLMNMPIALASVNMWSGGYTHVWTAIDANLQGVHLKIIRTYNSRSLSRGVFGFGWCSTIELTPPTTATNQLQRSLRLDECGAQASPNAGPQFSPTNPPGFRLQRDDDGRIEQIFFKDRSVVEFQYNPTGQLSRVRAGNRFPLFYTYQDGELFEAKDGDGQGLTYRYSALNNLTEIQYPDQTSEMMSYDDDRDLITSRQGRDGCLEVYRFSTTRQNMHLIAQATRKCGGLTVGSSRHDFWHETTKDGHTYLAKVAVEQLQPSGHTKKEFRFDSQGRKTNAKPNEGIKNELL